MKFRSSKDDQEPTTTEQRSGQGSGADSLIGSGTLVDGNCTTTGTLRIDGRVTGNVRARQLTVGPDGRVEGDVSGPDGGPAEGGVLIEGRVDGGIRAPRVDIGRGGFVGAGLSAREAAIRGRVVGPVVARTRLVLEETAIVEGNVTALRLAVREGGRVSGTIRIGEPDEESEAADPRKATATDSGVEATGEPGSQPADRPGDQRRDQPGGQRGAQRTE